MNTRRETKTGYIRTRAGAIIGALYYAAIWVEHGDERKGDVACELGAASVAAIRPSWLA